MLIVSTGASVSVSPVSTGSVAVSVGASVVVGGFPVVAGEVSPAAAGCGGQGERERPHRRAVGRAHAKRVTLCSMKVGLATVAVAAALIPTAVADARTLHVSPAGDDAGPGTAALPFRTIQRGVDAARGRHRTRSRGYLQGGELSACSLRARRRARPAADRRRRAGRDAAPRWHGGSTATGSGSRLGSRTSWSPGSRSSASRAMQFSWTAAAVGSRRNTGASSCAASRCPAAAPRSASRAGAR